jgi:uncharacterized protein YgiM (DUF1202 family)
MTVTPLNNSGSTATTPSPTSTASPAPTGSAIVSTSPAASPVTPGGATTAAAVAASGTPAELANIDYTKERWVAFVSGDGTNVRDHPSTEKPSKVLFKVSKGTKGFVQARKSGWTQLKWDFNKKVGWTRDDLLLIGPDEVIRNLMADNQGNIASISFDKVKTQSKRAAELAQTISVAVAKPAPPSETVKGFIGDKLPPEGVIVSSPFARVRDKPSRQAAETGRVPKGITVKIKSAKQIDRYYWFEILYNNGKKEGWTREDNLKF